MKEVTKEEFYAAIHKHPGNVQSSIVSDWDDEIGYITEWTVNRILIGKSQCGNCHGQDENKKFWLV